MRLSELVSFPSTLSPANPSSSSLVRTTHCPSFHVSPSTYSSLSNFQLIINNALDKYKKRTKNDLLAHPLVAQLQSCNSPDDILAVFQQQVQGLDQALGNDERWLRWFELTVNVLYTRSSTLAAGVGLVCLKP